MRARNSSRLDYRHLVCGSLLRHRGYILALQCFAGSEGLATLVVVAALAAPIVSSLAARS